MSAGIQIDGDFAFAGLATPEAPTAEAAQAITAQTPNPLGALAALAGTWVGHGFNAIWRPHNPASPQDRFLELNMTNESLIFTPINGAIPNRGLAMPDIDMFGLTYLQQISEASTGAGLHIEPGIWANVPHTTDPQRATVGGAHGRRSRMAPSSSPRASPRCCRAARRTSRTTTSCRSSSAAPRRRTPTSTPWPRRSPSSNLSQATQFRFVAPGVTQAIVKNPNSVLQTALQSSLHNTSMKSRTFLHVATNHNVIKAGGGTANTAFLSASGNPPGGNAKATQMECTFWIETIAGTGGQPDKHQLQYTQLVMLDFNGIHWPHVTVGTLVKQ